MTPADLAMKRALDEGAQYGRLRPMAAAANPYHTSYPEANLTTFTPRSQKSSASTGPSLSIPVTPQFTLHQFRQFQQSPALSSSSDLDYKRVRRKKSYAHLGRLPFESASSLQPTTSSSPSIHAPLTQNFLPSLLPPLPFTPVSRPGTKAPSLSSTVDTIQSTPTHTPVSYGHPGLEQWRELERVELSEPIRTKRKFPLFKQAKRLPHHTALEGGGGRIWEVHAAVIDIGGIASVSSDLERSKGENAGIAKVTGSLKDSADYSSTKGAISKADTKKGRSVRFKEVEVENGREELQRLQSVHSKEEKDPSLSSSLSLSKFDFPEPPGRILPGVFGQYSGPTPPTSPATLQYKGISFDVVNPHDSLLLGSSEIETPAEIDGLLDDYFDSRYDLSTMLPYDDFTGEASSSQHSLRTASSNGRQRILFNDPDSARRTIMGIRDGSSPLSNNESLYQDSPLANRYNRSATPLSRPGAQAQAGHSMMFGLDGHDDAPRPLQIHRSLREALRRGAATRPGDDGDGFENVDLSNAPEAQAVREDSANEGLQEAGAEQVRAVERGSSLYPHSQISDPFPLTVSDLPSAQHFNNIDEVVSGGRPSSYYAGNAAYYDREEDFQIYEDVEEDDVADANATQSTLEGETTVGNILSHYNYQRPPLAALDDTEITFRDSHPSSSSAEALRAFTGGRDVFQVERNNPFYNRVTGRFDIPGRTSGAGHRPEFNFRRPQQACPMHGPPNVRAPHPPLSRVESRAPRLYTGYADLPPSDQTYGNTGQLLQLTPQASSFPIYPEPQSVPSIAYPHPGIQPARRHLRQRAQIAPIEQFRIDSGDDYEEDKENTPPGTSAGQTGVQPGLSIPSALPRSSSVYPDDESVWESTQASESRANLGDRGATNLTNEDRPSQESYANTSRCSSDHRLSMPHPAPCTFDTSGRRYEVTSRPRIRETDPAIPYEWQNMTMTRKGKMREIPEGRAIDGTLLGADSPLALRDTVQQQPTNISDLERLRQKSTSDPAGFIAKFGKMFTRSPSKTGYSPKSTVSKAVLLGSNREAHESTASDRLGLLEYHGAPVMSGALQFSDTANTFKTSPRTPIRPTEPFSPLNPTPVTPLTSAFLRSRNATESAHVTTTRFADDTPILDNIELRNIRKKKPMHVSRAAMSSQTELQPLTLVDSTASAVTGTGRLTAAQLAEMEPGWTTEPNFSRTGALRRYMNPEAGFGIQQVDGSIERVSLLMRPNEGRNLQSRRLQKYISRPYFHACIFCPLSALLFGMGGLDWRMRQLTKGRITEMTPGLKKRALEVYVALGIIIYAAFGVMIAMIVISARPESYH